MNAKLVWTEMKLLTISSKNWNYNLKNKIKVELELQLIPSCMQLLCYSGNNLTMKQYQTVNRL